MENIRLVIGIFVLILAGVVHFIHATLEAQIVDREIESAGFRGIPIVLSGVGLPFLSAYLIVGTKNLGIFAIYGFGLLLITSSGAFVIKTVLDFVREPVIISKPKGVGARGTFIYTTIQIILIGALMFIILISVMTAYKWWTGANG